MPQLVSASGVSEKKYCRNRISPNNEVKSFPQISDKLYVNRDERFRHNWGFAFSHASRSSESILGALQWLRQSFEEGNIDVCWIVSEMIDWLKVGAPTVLIQESLRNSNYCEESNGRSSTAG